jgi:hypothetical protein
MSFNCNQSQRSQISRNSTENKYTSKDKDDKVVIKPLNLKDMLKLGKGDKEGDDKSPVSPSGRKARRRPVKRIFSTIKSTCVKN